jgi:hypothetical protein
LIIAKKISESCRNIHYCDNLIERIVAIKARYDKIRQ